MQSTHTPTTVHHVIDDMDGCDHVASRYTAEVLVKATVYVDTPVHVYKALNQECRRYGTATRMGKMDIVTTWRPRVTSTVPAHTYRAVFRRTFNKGRTLEQVPEQT
jgi:hypothetical protein